MSSTTLEEQGISLPTLRENIDTTAPSGKSSYHPFGDLAEFERDLIRARTMAWLNAARAQGRNRGRPTIMTAMKIERARELYEQGQLTVAEIAKTLGVSRASIYGNLPPVAIRSK